LNGLVTLPAIYYAEEYPGDADVLSLAGGGWTNVENMQRLVANVRGSGAIEKSMQEADGFVDRALACLAPFPACAERDALESLATYTVDRKR
jgi:geranylgeranyl pyrophosphate synthase